MSREGRKVHCKLKLLLPAVDLGGGRALRSHACGVLSLLTPPEPAPRYACTGLYRVFRLKLWAGLLFGFGERAASGGWRLRDGRLRCERHHDHCGQHGQVEHPDASDGSIAFSSPCRRRCVLYPFSPSTPLVPGSTSRQCRRRCKFPASWISSERTYHRNFQ